MTDTSRWLENIGVDAPPGFPAVAYNACFLSVRKRSSEQALWGEFGGAWNAVAYRFFAVVHYADDFRDSVATHGTSPKSPIRAQQERALFGFFTNAVSCVEATYYGLFAVGAFLKPTDFPLTTPQEQRDVFPGSTHKAYIRVFPGQPIVEALGAVLEDDAFKQFRDIRNILAHRSHPGRVMYVVLAESPKDRTEWKLGPVELTPDALTSRRSEVVRLLGKLLEPAAPFIAGQF